MDINSSQIPYVTVADLLIRKDARSVAQYLSDDPANPISVSSLPTNVALLEIISSGCGELESACLKAGIYATSDLLTLSQMVPPSGATSFLKKIICNIVMFNLVSRRPGPEPSIVVQNDYEWSMKQLEDLANGKRIFGFEQTEQAGLPVDYQMQPVDQIRNLFLPAIWQRSFGVRTNMQRPF